MFWTIIQNQSSQTSVLDDLEIKQSWHAIASLWKHHHGRPIVDLNVGRGKFHQMCYLNTGPTYSVLNSMYDSANFLPFISVETAEITGITKMKQNIPFTIPLAVRIGNKKIRGTIWSDRIGE